MQGPLFTGGPGCPLSLPHSRLLAVALSCLEICKEFNDSSQAEGYLLVHFEIL